MALDGGVGVDVYAPAGEDHPQPPPLGRPALYVLAAQVGLNDLRRAQVLAYQTLFGLRVDEERLVQAGQDAAIRLDPGEFGKGDAVLADLRHQVVHG